MALFPEDVSARNVSINRIVVDGTTMTILKIQETFVVEEAVPIDSTTEIVWVTEAEDLEDDSTVALRAARSVRQTEPLRQTIAATRIEMVAGLKKILLGNQI